MSRPPLDLRPGQSVWCLDIDGNVHQCTIVRPVSWPCGEQCYAVRWPDGRILYAETELIRQGEIRRCEVEMARAQAEIATDEGALLGYRDWKQEKELLEK